MTSDGLNIIFQHREKFLRLTFFCGAPFMRYSIPSNISTFEPWPLTVSLHFSWLFSLT